MAVEIPVVVDIEGAFQDAAKRAKAAMGALQSAIESEPIHTKITINNIESTNKELQQLNDYYRELEKADWERVGEKLDLSPYINQAIMELRRLEKELNEIQELRLMEGGQGDFSFAEEYRRVSEQVRNVAASIAAMESAQSSLNESMAGAGFQEYIRSLTRSNKELEEMRKYYSQLEADTRKYSNSINALRDRISELSAEWNNMTAAERNSAAGTRTYEEYKKVSKELRLQAHDLAKVLEIESRRAARIREVAHQRRYENSILNTSVKTIHILQEQERILSERLNRTAIGSSKYVELKKQLEAVRLELSKINGDAISSLGEGIDKTNSKLNNLIKNAIRLYALHAATSFIKNIREVTAEFEMQRVALGGIIQDSEEANLLFRQIKAAAIESPFEIKDLVTFTKQLSAYRIETENLFDITMKLADVSAGLGVDMNRLVLAYGQVRAASVLRGQELRQFTEAGIPLVELLADKFTDLNGKMVSTADVFELISKRAVPFEMIAEIFDDMTSAGGTFYKMQAKQAETLAGQWANLKDALSIMYDEIGNTTAIHGAMEKLISDAKTLMQNWRVVATVLKSVGIQFATLKIASLFLPNLTYNTDLAKKATMALARAQQLESAQQTKSNAIRALSIKQLQSYANSMNKAAAAQTLFGRSWYKLAASMAGGGWIGLVASGLTVVAGLFISAYNEAHRLEKELDKIGGEGSISISRSVANFNRLADAAVNAADGSDEQNKALAELQRTYGDIIPSQDLQISKLTELKGNYESLTEAIREKINMQIREQKINAATDYYSSKIQKGRKRSKDLLAQYGLDKEQINAVLDEIQNLVDKGMLNTGMRMNERAKVIEDVIKRLTGLEVKLVETYRYGEQNQFSREIASKAVPELHKLVDTYINLNEEQDRIEKEMENAIGTMGIYAKAWDDLKDKIKGVTVSEVEFGEKHTFAYKKEKIRKEVEVMAEAITEAFKNTNIDISGAISGGTIDFKKILDSAKAAETQTGNYGLTNYIKSIQKSYEAIVPTDQMVGVVERKFGELASAAGLTMDDIQGYLFRGNEDLRDYVKGLKSFLQDAEDAVVKLNMIFAAKDFMTVADRDQLQEAEATVEFLKNAVEFLDAFSKKTKSTPRHEADPFIAQLQERMKFMQDFKKGYDEFKKYLDGEAALEKEAGIMAKRGLALGIDTSEQRKAARDLSRWYADAMNKAFDKAKKKGAKGTIDDFLAQEIKGTSDQSKTLREFQKLIQSLWDAKTDLDTSEKKKEFEDALTRLSDEIKRSEAARNFYKNIFDLTGDNNLAADMTVSVYGGIGQDFKDRLNSQLNEALSSVDASRLTDELKRAFESHDFAVILANLDKFPEKWQDMLKDMANANTKYNADLSMGLLKSLETAKTYSEKRVEISLQSMRRLAEIEALKVSDSTKDVLKKRNIKKEAEAIASLEYEAFKDTPMYVELFANLDQATVKMLNSMKVNLENLKSEWKDLHPKDLKEMQSRLNEIYIQLAAHNPFRVLIDSIKEYNQLQKGQTRQNADAAAIGASSRLEGEKKTLDYMTEQYEEAVKLHGLESQKAQDAKIAMEIQQNAVDLAEDEANAAQETANQYRRVAQTIVEAAKGLSQWTGYMEESIKGVGEIVSTFGSNETTEVFNIVSAGVTKTLSGIARTAGGVAKIFAGDFTGIVDIVTGLGSAIAGVFGSANEMRIRKANKDIEEQGDLIEDLEYQYSRLETAIAKSFGSDYITNYNQQLDNLLAKQEAYMKQAEAERSKGKKADQDKIKEYENSAREVGDQLTEMQTQLSEFFTDTDLTSAAKDFANAWIEAYKEFGSTTDAMKERFQDMIQNMVEKSLAAKIMQELLQPIFDQIDILAKEGGDLSVEDISAIARMANTALPNINDAMGTLMNTLAAAGYNIRQHPGQFSGISRNIANATEESISGLAAGINTQNYYMQYMPIISANVATIVSYLTGGAVDVSGATPITPTNSELTMKYLSALPTMDENLALLLSLVRSMVVPRSASPNSAQNFLVAKVV